MRSGPSKAALGAVGFGGRLRRGRRPSLHGAEWSCRLGPAAGAAARVRDGLCGGRALEGGDHEGSKAARSASPALRRRSSRW